MVFGLYIILLRIEIIDNLNMGKLDKFYLILLSVYQNSRFMIIFHNTCGLIKNIFKRNTLAKYVNI